MLTGIATAGAVRERHISDTMEQVAMVDDPVADDVNHLAFLLHAPFQTDHGCRHYGAALRLEAVGPKYVLAMPVSSSIVMNSTPFAEPGF